MNNYNNPKYSIFFGEKQNSPFTIEKFRKFKLDQKEILQENIHNQINKINNSEIQKPIFLNQTHSTHGFIINNKPAIEMFSEQGDYLITNMPKKPIGVLTADCLPIIFYDNKNNVIAIAHAGWKGTIGKIALEILNKINLNFNSQPKDVQIFFGPSAKVCCYEVSEEFCKNIVDPEFSTKTIIKKNHKIKFDLPLYNELLLKNAGVKNINLSFNECTICNDKFCSYRKEQEKSGLQMTILTLK